MRKKLKLKLLPMYRRKLSKEEQEFMEELLKLYKPKPKLND